MRKELKVGLAIGGILAATGIVYLISGNHGAVKVETEHVVLVTPGAPSPGASQQPGSQSGPDAHHVDPPLPRTDATPHDPDTSAPGPMAHNDLPVQDDHVRSVTPDPTSPGSTLPHSDKVDVAMFLQTGQTMLAAVTPTAPTMPDSHNSPDQSDHTSFSPVDPMSPPARSPSPAPSPSTRPAARTHKVQPGETFASIAAAVYGNSKYFTKLLAANPNVDPKKLRPGMMINIPELTDAAGPSTPTNPTHTARPEAPIDPKTSYRVAAGDTLDRIAQKLYGKSSMRDDLYEANKALIGNDPGRLKIGWILKLPTPPTQSASPRTE